MCTYTRVACVDIRAHAQNIYTWKRPVNKCKKILTQMRVNKIKNKKITDVSGDIFTIIDKFHMTISTSCYKADIYHSRYFSADQ